MLSRWMHMILNLTLSSQITALGARSRQAPPTNIKS